MNQKLNILTKARKWTAVSGTIPTHRHGHPNRRRLGCELAEAVKPRTHQRVDATRTYCRRGSL